MLRHPRELIINHCSSGNDWRDNGWYFHEFRPEMFYLRMHGLLEFSGNDLQFLRIAGAYQPFAQFSDALFQDTYQLKEIAEIFQHQRAGQS